MLTPPTMFASAEKMPVIEKELNIPSKETVVYRSACLEVVEGFVGRVGELILDHAHGRILYITMMRDHLWGKKDITIPIAYVDHTDIETVYLKGEKEVIEDLPLLPVNRPWKEVNATDLDIQENLAPNMSACLLVEHRWYTTARQAFDRYGAEFFHQRFTDPAETQPPEKYE